MLLMLPLYELHHHVYFLWGSMTVDFWKIQILRKGSAGRATGRHFYFKSSETPLHFCFTEKGIHNEGHWELNFAHLTCKTKSLYLGVRFPEVALWLISLWKYPLFCGQNMMKAGNSLWDPALSKWSFKKLFYQHLQSPHTSLIRKY